MRWSSVLRALAYLAGAGLFLVVVQVLWGPPAGIVVFGALVGGLTALISLGIALVYRANRILNFAQGDLGFAPASLAVLLIVSSGLSWLAAFVIGIVAAFVVGAVVEFFVIRRFFRAPRLILSVATIGLAQVLAGVALLLPRWFAVTTPPQDYPAPINTSFTIGTVHFGGNEVIVAITVPVVCLLLALFLRTRVGAAVRGTAENADRASLLGIPVRRLETLVWAIAAVLAFLSVFLRAGIGSLPLGTVLGPAILLRALAAAVIGGMERLPTIVAAAVALGIIDQSVQWGWGHPQFVDPVIFVIVLVALLLTPQGRGLRGGIEPSTWRAVREPRPVPRELARLPEVRWVGIGMIALVTGALIVVPAFLSESRTNLAAVALIYAVIGLSLVVLTGWAGEVSLGQMAFVAIGGAVGGSITARWGTDLGFGLLGAGLVGAAVAALIGLPVLRRRGLTIAVITLAFSLMTTSWLLNPQFFGEGARFDWLPPARVERPKLFGFIDVGSETRYYFLCLAALGLAVVAVRGIRRSRSGRVLVAIRENELAASAYGVNPRSNTLMAFALSGFLAAFAGALFVHQQNGIQLGSYSAGESLVVFAMVVIGGLGSIPGALLGAFYVRGVTWALPVDWQILVTGAGLLVVLLLFPGGLGAAFADLRDAMLRRVAARRGLASTALAPVPRPKAAPRVASAPPMDSATAALRVRALDVEYDGVQVLFGVDVDVMEGETVAVLGTNGSGKSTLLRAVSGLVRARHGTITLFGRDATRLAPERIAAMGVGNAPGGTGVFPSLTVAEHLRLARWLRRDARAADDALARFPQLAERRHERAGDLSGGEQQLLTLTMALVMQPRLLLVDELTLGLAPAVADHVVQLLRELRAAGTTIVVVEQSLDVALRLADRAYFLEHGEVRFEGPPQELLERPDLVRAVFLGRAAEVRPTAALTATASQERTTGPRVAAGGLSKHYGGVVALDDVSFTVGAGEILGFVGANGAGKTTLFDVISGFVESDRGTITMFTASGDAIDLTHRPPHVRARLGLGRSFQDGRLFPALTVRETIAVALEHAVRIRDPVSAALHLPAVTRSEAAIAERVEQLVDLLGLAAYANTFVHELSTGTRRLVDLACVLGHEPSVLLLDEPSSGLAQRESEALAPLLLRVRDELGASVLVIEHDVPLLRAVTERLVGLDLGRVVATGEPATVLLDPAVSRTFLGSTPP